jgi:hypothetical protein
VNAEPVKEARLLKVRAKPELGRFSDGLLDPTSVVKVEVVEDITELQRLMEEVRSGNGE